MTLQQGVNGYAGMTNAYVTSAKGSDINNYAGSTTLSVKGNGSSNDLALMQWNLTSAQVTGTPSSASITINVTSPGTGTFSLYAVNQAWNPSQVTYDQPANGQMWQANAFGTTVLGTVNATTAGQATITLNSSGLSVLQGWMSNPSSNYGFVMMAPTTGGGTLTFSSAQDPTAANHPSLSINYQQAGIFVSAGPNSAVTQTSVLTLNGSVVDDDPQATQAVATTWSELSGPGTVSFQNPNGLTSDAVFRAADYVLQLSATDGLLSSSSQVTIIVEPPRRTCLPL